MKMAKYKVEIGAFVEYMRCRNIVVHAKNEKEAEEKAQDIFEREMRKNIACGDIATMSIDSIELLEGR